jgi:hypothetical protein
MKLNYKVYNLLLEKGFYYLFFIFMAHERLLHTTKEKHTDYMWCFVKGLATPDYDYGFMKIH